MTRKRLTLLAASLALNSVLRSQDEKPGEDRLRQLADLLNTKVTVASKRSERMSDAAATVTSYSSTFLEEVGINTLADLADITPGYSSFSIYGERVFETRGQKAGSFNNNRHLLLVDGIPVSHARNFKVPAEEELPLQFAERVEFLRGPASSLYGAGAFFGVVSITPKKSSGGTSVETLAGGGNGAGTKRLMSTITHADSGSETLLSFSYFSKGDSGAFAGTANSSQNTYRDGHTAMFLMASHKLKDGPLEGLGFGTICTYKTGNLGELWNRGAFTSPVDQLTWASVIPYLKYARRLSEDLTFNGYLKYNESQEKGGAAPFSSPPVNFPGTGTVYSVYDIRIANEECLAEVQWTPIRTFELVAGLNYDGRWQKGAASDAYNIQVQGGAGWPYAEIPVSKTGDYRTTSLYVQARNQFPVLAGLSLVTGLRLDRGEAPGNEYSQLSPRIGLVQKVTERFTLKTLYGTALRGPGIKEVELNREKKITYPGLQLETLGAEKFKTFEVAANYTDRTFSGVLTWFANRTTDALDPSQDPALHGSFYNNSGLTKATGFEVELRFITPTGWRGWLNYSAAKATDPNGLELNEIPAATGSVGLTYTMLAPIVLQYAGIIRYLGEFRVADPTKMRPAGGTFLDFRMGLPPANHLGMSLEVRNLTNKVIKYPKSTNPDVPSPGRSLMFNLWLRF